MQLSLFRFFRFSRRPSSRIKIGGVRSKGACRPDPMLQETWTRLRRTWFPQQPEIDDYRVAWSRRPQKRTLASCSIDSQRISVARELNYPQYRPWLEPLLYHEMCHVSLGSRLKSRRGKTPWHGREFKTLERRHPATRDLDIWIKSGGWATAVRSDRGKCAYLARESA